jgi:hypothetical protein
MISTLIWGDAPAQPQAQLDVNNDQEGVQELEQLVAQVSDLKNGEYVIVANSSIISCPRLGQIGCRRMKRSIRTV